MNLKKLVGASALALLMGAGIVYAKAEVGDEATDVTAGDFINIEPTTMLGLKGRVIFFELFGTT